MAHAAHGRVKPGLLLDVVGDRQRLQPTALPGRKEVVDVLAAQHMHDRQLPLALRPAFQDPALVWSDLRPVGFLAHLDFAVVRLEFGGREGGVVGLHRQAMMGRRPQPVEVLVTFPADRRTGQDGRRRSSCVRADGRCRHRIGRCHSRARRRRFGRALTATQYSEHRGTRACSEGNPAINRLSAHHIDYLQSGDSAVFHPAPSRKFTVRRRRREADGQNARRNFPAPRPENKRPATDPAIGCTRAYRSTPDSSRHATR